MRYPLLALLLAALVGCSSAPATTPTPEAVTPPPVVTVEPTPAPAPAGSPEEEQLRSALSERLWDEVEEVAVVDGRAFVTMWTFASDPMALSVGFSLCEAARQAFDPEAVAVAAHGGEVLVVSTERGSMCRDMPRG